MVKLEVERIEPEGLLRLYDPDDRERFSVVLGHMFTRAGQPALDDVRAIIRSQELAHGIDYELPDEFVELFDQRTGYQKAIEVFALAEREARKREN